MFLALMFLTAGAHAQNVQIMDLSIAEFHSQELVHAPDSAIDSTDVKITFMIDDPSQATDYFISFATARDSADIFSVRGQIVQRGGKDYTSYNGSSTEIRSFTACHYMRMNTMDFMAFSILYLKVKMANGLYTDRIYLEK